MTTSCQLLHLYLCYINPLTANITQRYGSLVCVVCNMNSVVMCQSLSSDAGGG